ncbi:HAF repeat-containing PEP-CTERM protein [Methylophilus sp. 5]|uniref:HAF repeat-containing PEP-CTERM protein n=1 Tax=Methylophilus sp. 5 TaxID=1112274 RepID=UPI0004900F39|nr:HAF repeat-containing PEP-CTERM protein [Methylophilus sp. 5]
MRQLCFLLGYTLFSPSIYAAPQYLVTELTPQNGFMESYASSINDKGQIAGNSSTYVSVQNQLYLKSQATIWSLNSKTTLDTPLKTVTLASSINDDGQVAGTTFHAPSRYGVPIPNTPHASNATLWDNGMTTTLASLGGTQSGVNNLNNSGQLVGWSQNGQSRQIATLWQNGNVTALSTPEQSISEAYAINNNGVIVGQIGGGGTFNVQAAAWNNNTLTYLNASGNSQAFDINDNNQIVGWSDATYSRQFATLWDNGVATELGTLGGYASFAYAINNHGAIVGSYISNDFGELAVLWEDGNPMKLQDLLVNQNGISLYTADDINNQGWIVANGMNSSGEFRSFLLMPVPEPSNIALLLTGLVTAVIALRKRLSHRL